MAGAAMEGGLLLTGASGFVGRHVLARLRDRGVAVTATASPGRGHAPDTDVDWREVDLTDPIAAAGLVAEVRPSH